MSEREIRLLLGLDELLDTRIATVARIDPKKAAEILADPYYSTRPWDLFPGIDDKEYKTLYEQRNTRTLLEAQSTPVIAMIRDFVKRATKAGLGRPVTLVPIIHINTYPYNLSEEEKGHILRAVRTLIPLNPMIEMVHYSMDELNPAFLGITYKTFICYEGHKWLEKYSSGDKLLTKYPCQNVDLFVPAILDKPPENANFLEAPEGFQEKMFSMSIFAQLFINLFYIGVDNFCSYLAKRPEVETPSEEELSELEKELGEATTPFDPDPDHPQS